MNKFAISWSGGKDSTLALYRARTAGFNIVYFLSVFADNGFTRSHRIPRQVLQKQTEAAGAVQVECTATWQTYEEEFKKQLVKLKNAGIKGCVLKHQKPQNLIIDGYAFWDLASWAQDRESK